MGVEEEGHVEGWVLAQEDHVEFVDPGPAGLAEREVVALLATHLDRLQQGLGRAAQDRELARVEVVDLVPAGLRLEHEDEGRVLVDRDPRQRIHHEADAQPSSAHARTPAVSVALSCSTTVSASRSCRARRRGPMAAANPRPIGMAEAK